MSSEFPSLTCVDVRSIHREDIKHSNADGTHWVCTRLYFKNEKGDKLMTVILYGDENLPPPEFKSKPLRDSILDQQL